MDWLETERAVLHRCLKDATLMSHAIGQLHGYVWSEKATDWVWNQARECFEATGETPSTTVIQAKIDSLPEEKQEELMDEYIAIKVTKPEVKARSTIRAMVEKNRATATLEAMERASEHFARGDGKTGISTLEKGLVSKEVHGGFKAKRLIPKKFRALKAGSRIPTGMYGVDKYIGGLQKGESGLILGATGVGKSAMAMTVAHAGVKYGRKVLYIDTENGEHVSQARFLSRFTGINYTAIEQNQMGTETKERLDLWTEKNSDRLNDSIRIVYLGYMNATLPQVEAAIRQEIASGFQPDLIIFDSPDHLEMYGGNGSREVARWEAFTDTYNRIAGMWERLGVAGWSISQAAGENIENKIATTANVADAKAKVRVASIVISINAKIDPKTKKVKEGSERVAYIAKNRNGMARQQVALKTEFHIMKITAPPADEIEVAT